MNWGTWIAVFFTIWWTVLFAVLPWGVRHAEAVEKGHDPGAPANPKLLTKFIVTTAISAVLWLVLYLVIEYSGLSLRQ